MRRGVAVLAIALGVAAVAAPARADMPARVVVAGEGECPTAAAVVRALERLHPTMRAVSGGGEGVRVEVVDRGGSYEVRAGGSVRRLDDAARRCGERATAAALAATLLIDPPATPAEPEAAEADGPEAVRPSAPATTTGPSGPAATTPRPGAPATTPRPGAPATTPRPIAPPAPTAPAAPVVTPVTAPTAAPAGRPVTAAPAPPVAAPASAPPPASSATPANMVTRPAPTPRRLARLDLELTGVVDGAPTIGTAASEVTGGAALRLSLGGRYVAGTVGLSGLAPATATSAAPAPSLFGTIDVTVVRIPFDLGVRLLYPVGRVEPGADVSLAFAVLQLTAPALPDASTSTRLDVGLRVAPFLRIGLTSRLWLVAGVQMVVSFAPYDLQVANLGSIATTPRLWLGGGLGLGARL